MNRPYDPLDVFNEEIHHGDESDESDDNEGDIEDMVSPAHKGYQIPISEQRADMLYDMAGTEETEQNNEMIIHPGPHILISSEEMLIRDAKLELSIDFELDNFQVQAIVGLLNGKNVILMAPCGSGKMLVYYMAVHLLRKKYNLPNGVGICLQPLNNILSEKTNNNPPIKTAFLTMTGEAVKSGSAKLSHSLDEILTGDIGCLMGHAESFLSARGIIHIFKA